MGFLESWNRPTYDRSPPTGYREIDRWNGGVGWLAQPRELGQRASHAIESDDGVWVLDPIDAPGIDDLLEEYGDVAGVAVLSSHHARDAGRIASRHGVSVRVPAWMDRVDARTEAPVEYESPILGTLGFETRRVEPLSIYQGAIIYREQDGTLYVPDLLSTSPGYPVGEERIGMMLGVRHDPPRDVFEGMDPDRIIFGHGVGVFENASRALEDVLAGARKRLPRALATTSVTNLRLYLAAKHV